MSEEDKQRTWCPGSKMKKVLARAKTSPPKRSPSNGGRKTPGDSRGRRAQTGTGVGQSQEVTWECGLLGPTAINRDEGHNSQRNRSKRWQGWGFGGSGGVGPESSPRLLGVKERQSGRLGPPPSTGTSPECALHPLPSALTHCPAREPCSLAESTPGNTKDKGVFQPQQELAGLTTLFCGVGERRPTPIQCLPGKLSKIKLQRAEKI